MFLVDVSGGITILTWQPNPMTVTGRHGSVTGPSRVRHVPVHSVVRVWLIACLAVSAVRVHENELMGTTHDRHGPSRVRHGCVTGSSRVGLVSVMTKRVCHIVSLAYGL